MKKIVLAMIVALMGTTVMNAQQHRRSEMTPEQMVAKRVERLDKALSLTENQKAEITKIYTEEMNAMSKERPAKMERGQQPDEAAIKARHEAMKARRDATNASIESVLTPEQATKFAEIKNHPGKRGHGKHGFKGHRRGDGKTPPQEGCGKKCAGCQQD